MQLVLILILGSLSLDTGTHGESHQRVSAVCERILKSMDSKAVDCVGIDLDINRAFCGASGLDLLTAQSRISRVLALARADEVPASIEQWEQSNRAIESTVEIDGNWVDIVYSERTGIVSLSFLKTLPFCEIKDSLVPSRVLVVSPNSSFYPNLARVAKIEGSISVDVNVDSESGRETICVRSVSREHMGFEYGAVQAVKRDLEPHKPMPLGGYEVRFQLDSPPRTIETDSQSN